MNLLPTPEQRELAESVRRVLQAPRAAKRGDGAAPPNPTEPDATLAGLGWLSIGVPEYAGGAELALADRALVLREFGRALVPPRLVAVVIAARVAALSGRDDTAAAFGGGALRGAIVVPALASGEGASAGEVYLLDGDAGGVALLVLADRALLFERGDFVTRDMPRSLDPEVALVRAAHGGGAPLCRLDGPETHHETLVLGAAYCAGLCEAIAAMAAGYAKTREQFGQPIGAFQAVKHRCADLAIRADAAWSQVVFAALAVAAGRGDGPAQALAARLVAARYAIAGALENIQLHGAIGVTTELAAHRYLKRAHVMDLCFGSAELHRRALLACPPPQDAAA